MTYEWTATQIGIVRIRGPVQRDPAVRLAVSAQFARAELAPPGLPPAARLIVRSVKDPLPRRFASQAHLARPEPAWERAVQDKLGVLYRRAARPDHGRFPANAEAVLFRDESEMLACLTLDLSRGEHLNHWWWQVPLRHLLTATGNRLVALLQQHARQLPAILSHLATWGEAAPVVGSLSLTDVYVVLEGLVRDHGLSTALLRLPTSAPGLPTHNPVPNAARGTSESRNRGKMPAEVYPVAWKTWLPADLARSLNREQECLLGVGLALHHAPSRTRSPLFAAQVRSWWRNYSTDSSNSLLETSPVFSQDPHPEANPPVPQGHVQPDQVESPAPSAIRPVTQAATMPPLVQHPRLDSQTHKVEVAAHNKTQTRPRPLAEELRLGPPSDRAGMPQPSAEAAGEDRPDVTQSQLTREVLSEGVQTQLGGVLYLINLMDYLDLPSCFEADWGLSSQLGTWGLLDVLARALLDNSFLSLSDDPIWLALAELDGRIPEEFPGRDFLGSDALRIPESWFQAVHSDGEVFRWAVAAQRLRLWSEAGYILVDAPRGNLPADQHAQSELNRYAKDVTLLPGAFAAAPVAQLSSFLTQDLNKNLLRWLAQAVPCIRCRLYQALNSDSTNDCTVISQLLTVTGWLYVTATHVDLVAELDAISVPVRLAGLDRDPGWVPDLGRVVQFHFQ